MHYIWIGFGNKTALSLSMNAALFFLHGIPEAGRLALVGLSLIAGAMILRKILTLFQSALGPSRKADAEAK
jgi:hypothetical protein